MSIGFRNWKKLSRTPLLRLRFGQIHLLIVIGTLSMSKGALSQYLQVKDVNQNLVPAGGTVYSNPATNQWPMPQLEVGIVGSPDCSAVSLTLVVQFTDAHNLPTYYSTSHSMEACDTWTLGWATGVVEGGTATITGQASNGTPLSMSFYILGLNPSQAQVDQNYVGAPWFFGNIINQESRGRQFCSGGGSGCTVGNGYPVNPNNPDGIGMLQIDRTQNTVTDAVYWSYLTNMGRGLQILNALQSPAASAWSTQFIDMEASQGTNSNNWIVPGDVNYAYGSFSYTNPSAHAFQDANWIDFYNGGPAHNYVNWVPPSNGNPGAWSEEISGYVGQVLSQPVY